MHFDPLPFTTPALHASSPSCCRRFCSVTSEVSEGFLESSEHRSRGNLGCDGRLQGLPAAAAAGKAEH